MNTRTGHAAAALSLAALLLTTPAAAEEISQDRRTADARVSSAEVAAEASEEAAAEASRAIVRDAEKDLDLRLKTLILTDSESSHARIATIAAN